MNTENTVVHAGGPGPSKGQLARQIIDVLFTLPLFAITPLLRPWHSRWGATDEEVAEEMPGDDLVLGCQYIVTRAVSINAPPESVWPWLMQVGFGKAGYYSHDLLDNFGHPSASNIINEYQGLRIGDWIPMFTKVNDTTAFRVKQINPVSHLLWHKPDSTWAWKLVPTTTGTRLITRIRILYRWHMPADALFSLFLNEFGDFPMMKRMLLNLKERIEENVKTNSS